MSIDFAKYNDRLLFVPLGGSNEIGMNLNLYHHKGKWIMLDCGIGFAHEYYPGIEVLLPDIEFIAERKKDLLGIVLTHAHEDHIGAIPYLWRELDCPLYATPFTAALLKHKFAEMGPGKKPTIKEIPPGGKFSLGPYDLDFVGITHSIPEMQGVVIKTSAGTVMHTGDWKFDENPQVGPASDYAKLTRIGDDNVLAIVCDSTNVFVEGATGSEETVREHLTELISKCRNRVVVTTFASNIARLETIIKAGHAAGRLIGIAGRSMWRMVETAHEAGYLTGENDFLSDREIMNVPRSDALIMCTGSQGEPRAALTRIARGDHPAIQLTPGDTVIFASRKIPGNDMGINYIHNTLVRKKIEVITDKDYYIHVSGHPARDELTRMYQMVRPKIAVPTHGEARHLLEHAALARSLGVKETVEAANGSVILLEEGSAEVIGKVQSGYTAVDGMSLLPADGSVIRIRRKLRDDGAVFATVTVGPDGKLDAPVQLATPGILDAELDKELIAELAAEANMAVEQIRGKATDEHIREMVKTTIRRFLKKELDKKPIVEVHVVRGA